MLCYGLELKDKIQETKVKFELQINNFLVSMYHMQFLH